MQRRIPSTQVSHQRITSHVRVFDLYVGFAWILNASIYVAFARYCAWCTDLFYCASITTITCDWSKLTRMRLLIGRVTSRDTTARAQESVLRCCKPVHDCDGFVW